MTSNQASTTLEAEDTKQNSLNSIDDISRQKIGKHDLRIIGLGFQRCGSYSLKFALDILGFKCFHPIHMLDTMVQKQSTSVTMNVEWKWWYNLDERTKNKDINFDEYFDTLKPYYPEKEYDAVLDWPFCFYYKELSEYYPNAKCILLVRKNKEKWYGSFISLYKIFLKRNLFKFFGMFYQRALWLDEFGLKCLNCFGIKNYNELYTKEHKEILLEKYDTRQVEMINYFKSKGQSDRLLVFNFIDGEYKTDYDKWKVLCDFFNVAIPKDKNTGEIIKFPHKNQKKFLRSAFRSLGWLAAAPVLIASFVIIIVAILLNYYMY